MPRTISQPTQGLTTRLGSPRVRLWLRLTAGLLFLGGAAFAAREVNSWLLADPRFRLACEPGATNCVALQIRGTEFASRARIESVFASDFGMSVYRIPLAERRRHLLAIDWVSTATISRIWPDRIVVTISERQPVAFARLPMGETARYRLALVDDSGVFLSLPQLTAKNRAQFRLPVVNGLSEEQSEAERSRRLHAVSHLLEDLGPQAAEVSEVNARNTEDLGVITEIQGHAVELWIGDQHFRSRYRHFMANYDEIRKHSPDASVFDLRMDDRILAR